MKFFTQTKILTFLIIILLVSNISTIFTIYYQKGNLRVERLTNNRDNSKEDIENKGYIFREQLNLTDKQHEVFRSLRQNYNRNTRQLSFQMQDEREDLIQELSSENPDSLVLNSIAINIGELHTDLKRLTSGYYQDMRNECDVEQEQKLMEIFVQLLNNDGNVKLPESNGQGRRGNRNIKVPPRKRQ